MDKKKGMFSYADKWDKLLLIIGTIGSIGDGLQTPLTMFLLSDVINDYGNPKSNITMSLVNKYALRLLYVAIGAGLTGFVEGFCWARTAERQTARMRFKYLKSVLKQDVGFFDTQSADSSTTYQVVTTISSDSNAIQIAICEKIPDCIAYMSNSFCCFVYAFILSWKLTLAGIPFILMFIVPALVFGKAMVDTGMQMIESYGVAGGIAEQAISSIRTVYSYVAENETSEKFNNALQKTMDLGIKQGFIRGLMMGSMGVIYVCWAFQAWFGSLLVSKKGERGGDVFVAGFNVLMGGMNILTSLSNIAAITEAIAASSRINEIVNMEPSIDSEEKKGDILSYVEGEVEFKGVYFKYPSRPDTPILQGLNLKVPAGKTVGLVGSSGSGKSTIFSLLQRFYDPIEGEITLDGNKIKTLRLKWLRSQMGLVNQEPVLFATSIKENIMFGKEDASRDDMIKATKAANAHDFIMKLPDAYETQVGQFGLQLSGGQKQRIAIARALIRNPKILLLDEATSALDAESEKVVQKAIDHASIGRTTIVIAHRLSTIGMANFIIVLQSGKVVESGTHQQLMKMSGEEGGEYFKMVKSQQPNLRNDISSYLHRVEGIQGHALNVPYKLDGLNSPLTVTSSGRKSKSSVTDITGPPSMRDFSEQTGTPKLQYFSPQISMRLSRSFQLDDSSIRDDEAIYQLKTPSPSQLRLLKMNAPERVQALLGCIGAVGSGAVQPISAYCVGALISIYFKTDKSSIMSHARLYSFIFLGLGAFCFFTSILQHYNFAIMGEKLTKRVREKLLIKLMTFEIGWFDQDDNTSVALCARLSGEANMIRSLVGDRLSFLAQAILGATFAYVLGLYLTWRLSFVMIAAQPLVIMSFYARSVLMKSMSEKTRIAQRVGSQLASEAVVNHRTITAFSSQKRILTLFVESLEAPKRESVRQSWYSGVGLFSSQFLAAASTALAYWYGGKLLVQGLIKPESIFQTFLVLLFNAKIIADAASMTNDLSRGSNSVRSVFAILDRIPEINSQRPDVQDISIRGGVELRNVFFSYPSRPSQSILTGLSLEIPAGSIMALVGQSGSGKSTIISLIERFYDPLKGTVLIDEKDVRDYNLRSLRKHIGLVSQEPTLFGGTISENIAYGKKDATEYEIREAASLANAHEFISGMKDGYETYCGERGVQLSGGQKQRIAIARAMLKNPSILLLDEATSALDSISENLVLEALEKMMVGRTCIVVAHRLSTIQKSNSIAVIKEGRVVEQGSHTELLALCPNGTYHSLMNAQQVCSSPQR